MIIAVCTDDNNGMLFNNRRQSRDMLLIEDLIKYANANKILINEFSKSLFSDYENNILISDTFLSDANENDICFVENVDLNEYKDKINTLIIYKWNRVYPSDFCFNLDLSNYKLIETKDFKGNSHEKITREIYSL
jgi:hypothetical protein